MKGNVTSIEAKRRQITADEFGRLDAKLKEFAPAIKRHEQLKKEIQSWYDKADAETGHCFEGAEYAIEVGPKANKRTILDMSALSKRLGLKTFLNYCSFSLEKLDGLIVPSQHEGLVSSDFSGSRRVTATKKHQEAA